MKYVKEFRDSDLAKQLLEKIHDRAESDRQYQFMEFCGGHTHSLFRFGIPGLLPDNVIMRHGPGCPVCVLPMQRIDWAIKISEQPNVIFCSYGDMLRVPGSSKKSLLSAKAAGADIRMIYSPAETITIAESNPDKTVVFFAVGFETTTPPTVVVLEQAIKKNLKNLKLFCNHVLTPPAIDGIFSINEKAVGKDTRLIDGLIGPGHVSLITGISIYEQLALKHQTPIIISGFEPLDLMQSLLMLIEQINQGTHQVENQYSRAVTQDGNIKARDLINQYLELRETFEWRGLGMMENSALKIKERFSDYDAEKIFSPPISAGQDNKACECPAVLTGRKSPLDCKLFGNPCTPENPLGSCMVSSEGACAAYYQYHAVKSD